MEKINVRFSKKTTHAINQIQQESDCNFSDVARAAMQIGIDFISSFDEQQQSAFFSESEFIKLKSKESTSER